MKAHVNQFVCHTYTHTICEHIPPFSPPLVSSPSLTLPLFLSPPRLRVTGDNSSLALLLLLSFSAVYFHRQSLPQTPSNSASLTPSFYPALSSSSQCLSIIRAPASLLPRRHRNETHAASRCNPRSALLYVTGKGKRSIPGGRGSQANQTSRRSM